MLSPGSWVARRVEDAVRSGFQRAYHTVRVNPERYLFQLRVAQGLPIATFRGMATLPLAMVDDVADQVVRAGMKMAAAEGVGLGAGGLLTLLPDLSILAVITLRTIQKLSLVYGFEYNTDEEIADLWLAVASAAGVDITREFLEKEVVQRFVPRIIRRIAVQASREMADKWAGRVVPLLSSAIGGTLNYYFVRAWAERAKAHFRAKHLGLRQQVLREEQKEQPLFPMPQK